VTPIFPNDPNGIVNASAITASQENKHPFKIVTKLECYGIALLYALSKGRRIAIGIQGSGNKDFLPIDE